MRTSATCTDPGDGHCLTTTATTCKGEKYHPAMWFLLSCTNQELKVGKLVLMEPDPKLAEQVNSYAATSNQFPT